jgi:hypothetical protein
MMISITKEQKTLVLTKTAALVGIDVLRVGDGHLVYENPICSGHLVPWDPLTYDSDAFYLQVRQGLSVSHQQDTTYVDLLTHKPHVKIEYRKERSGVFEVLTAKYEYYANACEATRYAICAAVIAISEGYIDTIAEALCPRRSAA